MSIKIIVIFGTHTITKPKLVNICEQYLDLSDDFVRRGTGIVLKF